MKAVISFCFFTFAALFRYNYAFLVICLQNLNQNLISAVKFECDQIGLLI